MKTLLKGFIILVVLSGVAYFFYLEGFRKGVDKSKEEQYGEAYKDGFEAGKFEYDKKISKEINSVWFRASYDPIRIVVGDSIIVLKKITKEYLDTVAIYKKVNEKP